MAVCDAHGYKFTRDGIEEPLETRGHANGFARRDARSAARVEEAAPLADHRQPSSRPTASIVPLTARERIGRIFEVTRPAVEAIERAEAGRSQDA